MIPLRDRNPSGTFPLVTVSLILANVVVFFYEVRVGGPLLTNPAMQNFFNSYGAVPGEIIKLRGLHTLITSMFVHGGWMHLIGNMLYLWIFGDNVEHLLGHFRFLVFYLLAGTAAALTHLVVTANFAPAGLTVPMVGASGAISGVLGAYFVKYPRARVLVLIPIFYFITVREIPAVVALGVWFLLQLFSGLGSVGLAAGAGVAFWAHIGGFVAGIVLINLFPRRRRWR